MNAVRRPLLDRSQPPAAGRLRPFAFPPFLRRKLPSGLEVLAARQPAVPLLSIDLVFPAGAQHDPAGQAGLATLTASVMDEGTRRRNSLEIASWVEQLGGFFASGADWDEGYLTTGLLARHLEEGLDLLTEVVGEPTFPEHEVERLRRQRLAEILRRSHDPSWLADEKLTDVIYRGTVYARPVLGDEAGVSSLNREALVSFYRRHYTRQGAVLIAVGDLDPEDLLRRVEGRFQELPAEPPPLPEIRPEPLAGISVHIVDRPGATQTELRLGHPGVSRKNPDYIPLIVLNALLGGKFTSRINLNLRERHGYTYGATSRFSARLGPGPFLVDAAVATESAGAAAAEVLFELRRIREEPVEPRELEETCGYITGVFPYTFQTIGEFAKRLENLAVYGLPDDYYDRYLERIASVTREKLLEVARRNLHPDHIAVVAVGPAESLAPQFEGMGPVTVWPRTPSA